MLENILSIWEMLALLYVVIEGKIIHKAIPFLMIVIGGIFMIVSEKDYISLNSSLKVSYQVLSLLYFLVLNFFVYKILKKKYTAKKLDSM